MVILKLHYNGTCESILVIYCKQHCKFFSIRRNNFSLCPAVAWLCSPRKAKGICCCRHLLVVVPSGRLPMRQTHLHLQLMRHFFPFFFCGHEVNCYTLFPLHSSDYRRVEKRAHCAQNKAAKHSAYSQRPFQLSAPSTRTGTWSLYFYRTISQLW